MILVLPDKEANINDIINRFDVDLMYKEMREQRVIVKFPKFRVQSKLPLGNIFKTVSFYCCSTSNAETRCSMCYGVG